MLKEISLDIIETTLDSFDLIIKEIETQFIKCQNAGNAYFDELLALAVGYRQDVVTFLRSLYVLDGQTSFPEVIIDAIRVVEYKLVVLDDILERYVPDVDSIIVHHADNVFLEPETNLYS